MTHYDRRNVLMVCATLVLIVACVMGTAVLANRHADDVRIEQEKTRQVRVDACRDIEPPEVAALCIAAVKP